MEKQRQVGTKIKIILDLISLIIQLISQIKIIIAQITPQGCASVKIDHHQARNNQA